MRWGGWGGGVIYYDNIQVRSLCYLARCWPIRLPYYMPKLLCELYMKKR